MGRKARGSGITLRGGPAREPEGDSFTWDLSVEEGSEDGHLSS